MHINALWELDVVVKESFVKSLSDAKVSEIGVQAERLIMLRRMGFRLPKTYICTFRGFEEYRAGNLSVLEHIKKELKQVLSEEKSYSISPSMNVDDIKKTRCFREFRRLSVKGLGQITEAVLTTWELAGKLENETCYGQDRMENKRVRISVILQEKLQTGYSGVVFTRNPATGSDEVIVESVAAGNALEKTQMGTSLWVYKWGVWREKPKGEERYFGIVNGVTEEAKRIEKKCGSPVRVEWAHDGTFTYLLGLDILPSIEGINIYSNKMAKERLPGVIKPLVWDINVLLFNSSWKRILVEVAGKHAESINLRKMSKLFYHRAYFNMGVFGDIFELLGMPRESMEIILGAEVSIGKPTVRPSVKTFRLMPRVAFFALDKLMFSRKLVRFLEIQNRKLVFFRSRNLDALDKRKTLDHIEDLLEANREAAYFAIVIQMLNGFYRTALERYLEKTGICIQKIDFEHKMKRLQDIDPDHYLSILRKEYRKLPHTIKLEVEETSHSDIMKSVEGAVFGRLLADFLARFGHMSDSSTDFSKPQLRETPNLVLKMIGTDDKRIEETALDKSGIDTIVRNPAKRILLRLLFDYVTRHREYSERVSYLQSRGFALFRHYFLHLGKLFEKEGILEEEQDVYYLNFDEIRIACKSREVPEEYRTSIKRRKEEMAEHEGVLLPEIIYGDSSPIPLTKENAFMTLKGVAASRGYYEGKVKIVKGFGDFDKIRYGDVIVVPYSHVSWTPLFEKAKALISESGGMLSHCSILARERHIPAVVSVKGALELKDDMHVAVDGYKGEVIIIK